ncbi:GFA family protein [Limibaculum sp. FT325]|uniref:GFA family protein n=1 Tax=Thermohalobaculum sediminis TaxID=2939436 RepID=UPI0020BE65A2|nr:GFA family protein [Limibaculum sediminis]MCL5777938.1 GFA family protein [Limibaculum sediminis]
MPLTLQGSCRCGAVRFSVASHTPQPYQRCYCTICRKTAGGGGYAINIMGVAATLKVEGSEATAIYRAEIRDEAGRCEVSEGERHFCTLCATALWVWDPNWPDLVHPFASAIDTDLPVPPSRVHLMIAFRAPWVEPQVGPDDLCFDLYPAQSIEDWHRTRGLWIE